MSFASPAGKPFSNTNLLSVTQSRGSQPAKSAEAAESASSWSEEEAEKNFFKRLAQEEEAAGAQFSSAQTIFSRPPIVFPHFPANPLGGTCGCCTRLDLAFHSFSFYAYRVGFTAELIVQSLLLSSRCCRKPSPLLEAQLSDAGHERQMARDQIEQRDKTITAMRQQLAQQVAEINDLKTAKRPA